MDLVVVLVLFATFMVGCTAFWIWTIVDAAKTPDQIWMGAGQSKALWIVLLGVILSLVYVIWPRPALRRAAAATTGY